MRDILIWYILTYNIRYCAKYFFFIKLFIKLSRVEKNQSFIKTRSRISLSVDNLSLNHLVAHTLSKEEQKMFKIALSKIHYIQIIFFIIKLSQHKFQFQLNFEFWRFHLNWITKPTESFASRKSSCYKQIGKTNSDR